MTTVKTNTLEFDAQALREKILDLAMRGKLVPQDPNDEPASVLLEKIKAEKEQLIKEKKIKKKDWNLPEKHKIDNLPQGWQKTSLKEITTPFTLNDGDWILSKNMIPYSNVKLLQLGSIGEGKYIDKGFKYISQDTFDELNCTEIKPGYLLVNRLINKQKMMATILPKIEGKLITAVDICWIAPSSYFNQEFMMYQLLSPAFQNKVNKLTSGSTRKRISKGNLTSIELFLPPLEEQSRIAAKIAQLFALLRKVESSTQQYAKLQTLLKSKVLDLAMRGKLVEQDPHDEPASVLLKKIKAEKEQLVKEGKIKKSKLLPPVTDEEKPFDIPDSWEWVRLGDIGAITSGGTPKTSEKSYWINGTIPWITPAVMAKCKDQMIFNSESVKRINNLGLEKSSAHLIPKNSLVVSSRAPIGYVNIVPFEYTTNQGCKSVSLYKDISEEFIYFALKNSVSDMNNRASGTTFKEISGTKFSQTIIPLPPLKEQTKISQKIRVLATIIHNF